jgi:alpha-glucuronidase
MRSRRLLILLASAASLAAHAETGADGWLRYAPISNVAVVHRYDALPSRIVVLGDTEIDRAAVAELQRGLGSMLGRTFTISHSPGQLPDGSDAIVIGSIAGLKRSFSITQSDAPLKPEAFTFGPKLEGSSRRFIIFGGDQRGELYGVFRLLDLVATEKALPTKPLTESPSAPIRWVNQWDNLDGSIERGYAGRSIFFDDGHVRADLSRAADYARLLASIGINGCTVNNVNSDLRTLTPEMLHEFARIADAFRPWGVRLSLSVDLSSPQIVGHLPTFDPLDPTVAAWWQHKVDEIYTLIPDFGGFVVKADSEGRAGPSQYGRTPSQAANVLARALQPHHGVVLYRGFVYNHHLDWHDLKADRARAGFDNFAALDGTFEPNVVIQVKHGPIDFQIREPVSPLFGALQHTSQAIELQTTQEYTGQQRHMVFLVPMWKAALDTDLRAQNRNTPVKEIVEGKSFHQPLGGFVSVVNVGLDANWLHHPMAMANLYGFGRLAWNPNITSEQIIEDWTRLTFGNDPKVVQTINGLQLESWKTYEQYTGPLGLGTLTDIIGVHFGPGIESAERNGWGQWLRADHEGVGMDRTVATGTGYIGQYPPELAQVYESLATCPDDLLLFMHHVPYTHKLNSGKTVIQQIYDAHYDGASTAATYPPTWETLRGRVDDERFMETLKLFQYQAGHAIVWRDAVSQWFFRISGIPDAQDRVGNYPNRIEAESMTSSGYISTDVNPWETASGGKAVVCKDLPICTLTTTLNKPAGTYDIAIQYFDLRSGTSKFDLLLNDKPIAHWSANGTLPPAAKDAHLDGHTSARFVEHAVSLTPGDTLSLRGTPNGDEPAPVDYIEITPVKKEKLTP